MMDKRSAVAVACLLLFTGTAFAHRIDEYLQATMLSLEAGRVNASMRLIPGILVSSSVIAEIDTNSDGIFSPGEQQAYAERVLGDQLITVDGQIVKPALISCSFPKPAQLRDGLGEIHVEYTVETPPGGAAQRLMITSRHPGRAWVYLINVLVPDDHALQIVAQRRNQEQSLYEVDYQQAAPESRRNFALLLNEVEFTSSFHLGMRHIAGGTDHLLFLLTLLLPAPLLCARARWGPAAGVRQTLARLLGIVTAFTIGHSITLMLAVLGAVHVPSRLVEILVALSILVSALHALRPIVPGKEALVAGFFGLIHGLAFAATLHRLGLGLWTQVTGILAFNLGIEAMQLLVVAAVLPSLVLMSRTPAYPLLRIIGAMFASAASLGWLVERIFNLNLRVDLVVNTLALHAAWISGILFLLSLACRFLVPYLPFQIWNGSPSETLSLKSGCSIRSG